MKTGRTHTPFIGQSLLVRFNVIACLCDLPVKDLRYAFSRAHALSR